MKATKEIKIDLTNIGPRQTVHAMQDDVLTREVVISLYANGTMWNIPEGITAVVGYKKRDGTKGLYDTLSNGESAVDVSDGNVVTIILAAQMLTVAGTVDATVTLVDEFGKQLSTFCFDVVVASNPGSQAAKSEDYYNYISASVKLMLDKEIGAAVEATNKARDEAERSAELAQQAAAEKGWVYAEVENGHLYLVTENMETLNLQMDEGRLVMIYE